MGIASLLIGAGQTPYNEFIRAFSLKAASRCCWMWGWWELWDWTVTVKLCADEVQREQSGSQGSMFDWQKSQPISTSLSVVIVYSNPTLHWEVNPNTQASEPPFINVQGDITGSSVCLVFTAYNGYICCWVAECLQSSVGSVCCYCIYIEYDVQQGSIAYTTNRSTYHCIRGIFWADASCSPPPLQQLALLSRPPLLFFWPRRKNKNLKKKKESQTKSDRGHITRY